MKGKEVGYWVSTALLATETMAGGVTNLINGRTRVVSGPAVDDVMRGLGYPSYFVKILGVCKLPGAVALLAPRLPRLKEWAYAGIAFEMIGAAASHAVRRQKREMIVPLAILGLALTSWALRPPKRNIKAAR